MSKMRGLRMLEVCIDVRGRVDGMIATGVREMVWWTEAGVGVWVGGCEAVKVDGWGCGVWWEEEKEVFVEVVWGRVMRGVGRGDTGVHGEGQVGKGRKE